MKIYNIKLRLFPPREDIDSWFESDPTEWEWSYPDGVPQIRTEYGRRIRDETGRPGISVKLVVQADDGAEDPETWNWNDITELYEQKQVEFIRAALVEQAPGNAATCYSCGCLILGKPWTDGDGDMYCSEKCLFREVGEGAFRVAPDGTVIQEEE